MSTHAEIGRLREDGFLQHIYLHWDGYTEWAGRMLQEHYNTPKKVDALINLGSLSALYERLAPNPGEKHSFENPVLSGPNGGVTVAYHRDRKEPLRISQANVYGDIAFAFGKLVATGIRYLYLYDEKTGVWYTGRNGGHGKDVEYEPLADAIAALDKPESEEDT